MEIRIGVRDVAREVTFESDQSPDEVQSAVASSMTDPSGMLSLTDERGRTILVPVPAIGYVEIGVQEKGRVGFGTR